MQSAISKVGRSVLHQLRYNYTPISCYKQELKTNPIVGVFLSNGKNTFELHLRLFQNVAPRTSQNFRRLLLGLGKVDGRVLSLVDSKVHKYFARNYIEMGHLEGGNCSIYGRYFRDETFELTHDRRGILTCFSEENTNDSRFALTFNPCPYFDYKQTVFGEVTAETFDVLKEVERVGEDILHYKIVKTEDLLKGQPSYIIDHHYKAPYGLSYIS